MTMKYEVALQKSEEGFAVSVPGLPGCWSQGRTEAEALDNIRKAIEEYLAAVDGESKGATTWPPVAGSAPKSEPPESYPL
jgi:predicted RNase H-like HicB family nuclease